MLIQLLSRLKILFQLSPKIQTKDPLLVCPGAGSYQTRTAPSRTNWLTNSVFNWPTFLLPPEFSQFRSRSGSLGQLVFWRAGSATIPVSTTSSSSSAYRLWLSLQPLPGTEFGTLRAGFRFILMFLHRMFTQTVRSNQREARRSSLAL
jgi:hypothetical protein